MGAFDELDPLFHAQSLLRRKHYDRAIEICTELLAENPYDRAVWYVKTRALTLKAWIDDTEMEEEGVAELLLDENATAQAPRPGTSFSGGRTGTAANQGMRPMSSAGRPLTGFARPGTSARPNSRGVSVDQAFRGAKPGTARPVTALGRQIRLGTASMLSDPGGVFIDADKLDLRKYAARPSISKALCDFLLYHDHNPVKALELAANATVNAKFDDWWWKARLGKCYYQLGLFRDAEKQFKSSLRDQPMVATALELGKVYIRLDQPTTALEAYQRACEHHPADAHLLLGIARVHEALGDADPAARAFTEVLRLDASCVEALASLAGHHFYADQPELALRFYRRVLQLGVSSPELWNNLGLSCFFAGQYDLTLSCFERALAAADDAQMAEVWYNVAHVAIGIGDVALAFQAFKISVSLDPNHAEAYNNLGILELRRGNNEQARSNFLAAQRLAEHAYEAFYNGALLAYKMGELQESYEKVSKALEVYPGHTDSQELLAQLQSHFALI